MRPADARRRHRVPSAAADPVISLGHLKCPGNHPSYAPPNDVLRSARAAHAEALDPGRAAGAAGDQKYQPAPPRARHRHAWHPHARGTWAGCTGDPPSGRNRAQHPSTAAESRLGPGPQLAFEGLRGKGARASWRAGWGHRALGCERRHSPRPLLIARTRASATREAAQPSSAHACAVPHHSTSWEGGWRASVDFAAGNLRIWRPRRRATRPGMRARAAGRGRSELYARASALVLRGGHPPTSWLMAPPRVGWELLLELAAARRLQRSFRTFQSTFPGTSWYKSTLYIRTENRRLSNSPTHGAECRILVPFNLVALQVLGDLPEH